MSIKRKNCNRCGANKPVAEFRKAPTRFGGDGFSNGCKACLLAERRAKKQAAADQPAPEPEEPIPAEHQVAIAYCMPVNVAWNGDDFVLTQENDGDTHTVIVAPHALRRIWEFAEKLAHQQRQQESSTNE